MEHQAALNILILNFEINRVTNIVQTLLTKQVFQSDLIAKTEFSDLFTSSSVKKVQHDISEAETVCSAADILEEIIFAHKKNSERTQISLVLLSVELQASTEAQIQIREDINSCKQTSF